MYALVVLEPRYFSGSTAVVWSAVLVSSSIADHSRQLCELPGIEPAQVPCPGELPVPAESRPNEYVAPNVKPENVPLYAIVLSLRALGMY